jgi:hypothetical protein
MHPAVKPGASLSGVIRRWRAQAYRGAPEGPVREASKA